MSEPPIAYTDQAWMAWGERDPYFAVITMPEFRRGVLDEQAKARFFQMGERHASYVLNMCRRHVDPGFKPATVMDFGCGVGRVTLPLAAETDLAVGVDISPAMLAEADLNAKARDIANVRWVLSDDNLSRVDGQFDLIHSAIVFQHIDVPRGRKLFARLLECLAPGGIAALQLTYSKAYHADTYGQPPAPPPRPPASGLATTVAETGSGWWSRFRGERSGGEQVPNPAPVPVPESGRDPEMQMNPYNLTDIAFMMQSAGIKDFHTTFTDHGGEWGVFLFFQRPKG